MSAPKQTIFPNLSLFNHIDKICSKTSSDSKFVYLGFPSPPLLLPLALPLPLHPRLLCRTWHRCHRARSRRGHRLWRRWSRAWLPRCNRRCWGCAQNRGRPAKQFIQCEDKQSHKMITFTFKLIFIVAKLTRKFTNIWTLF